MILKECLLIDNDIYKKAQDITNAQPYGIVVHSTGANNPNLARYVQPVPSQSYYDEVIADIGKNIYGNSWNRPGVNSCVHAMIGYNATKVIETYQTMPFDKCCGGVWKGKLLYAGAPCYADRLRKTVVCYTNEDNMLPTSVYNTLCGASTTAAWTYNGQSVYIDSSCLASYNYNPTACLQFEMLEDSLTDEDYFNQVMREGQELCAYWCKMFNIPVDRIHSHKESYDLGYATGHGDPENWLKKFGKDMNWYRAEVQRIIDEDDEPEPEPVVYDFYLGEEVRIKDGVDTWANGSHMSSWVPGYTPYYVRGINGDKVTISTLTEGACTGTVWKIDIEPLNTEVVDPLTPEPTPDPEPDPVDPTEPDEPEDPAEPEFVVGDLVAINIDAITFIDGEAISDTLKAWQYWHVIEIKDSVLTIAPYAESLFMPQIKAQRVHKVIPVVDEIAAGDIIVVNSDATLYDGSDIYWRAKFRHWVVKEVSSDRILLGKSTDGKDWLENKEIAISNVTEIHPSLIQVNAASGANVRSRGTLFSNSIRKIPNNEYLIGYSGNLFWVNIGQDEWVSKFKISEIK